MHRLTGTQMSEFHANPPELVTVGASTPGSRPPGILLVCDVPAGRGRHVEAGGRGEQLDFQLELTRVCPESP